ncbi:MAG: hypothetical protein LC624_02140 [Halobacteriales archaeon]|nr:hypothetical protein [Halobacteriales archaeon]
MRAFVGLLLLTLALAGCTTPPPADTGDDGIFIGETPQPPKDKAGIFVNGTQVESTPGNGPGNMSLPNMTMPGGNTTTPPSGNGSSNTTLPPLGNTTNTTKPPANTTAPGNSTGGNATGGNATGPNTTLPNGTGSPPAIPTPNAPLPTWHVGDSHIYYGAQRDRNGQVTGEYYDWRNVTAVDRAVAGVPVYTVNATQTTTDGQSASLSIDNMTRDGLDHVNATGWVTELYRFPLWAGKNWTYGFDTAYQSEAGPFSSRYVGEVKVVGQEHLALPLCGCSVEAWKLHADITTSFGAFQRANHVDYWYAEVVRDTVKVHTEKDDGSTTDEQLTYADLR